MRTLTVGQHVYDKLDNYMGVIVDNGVADCGWYLVENNGETYEVKISHEVLDFVGADPSKPAAYYVCC